MLDENRRTQLGRAADIGVVAAVLGLAIFAYAELSLKLEQLAPAPAVPVFAELYQPGQNPWAGAIIEVKPAGLRFASLASKRSSER
jgi:hypothetical protein